MTSWASSSLHPSGSSRTWKQSSWWEPKLSSFTLKPDRGYEPFTTDAVGPGQRRRVIDIAQDLLLRHLHDESLLILVAFKAFDVVSRLYQWLANLTPGERPVAQDRALVLRLLRELPGARMAGIAW